MKTNITYIISNVNKALAFEWISTYLNKNEFNLNFILLNPGDSELEVFLKHNKIKVDRIKYTGKKDVLKCIFKTYLLLKTNKTNIVHTHLFDANIIGLTAAKMAGIPKRIHTRHHSNYHHLYHPKAIKYDNYINRISTDIVAISSVVKNLLIKIEKVPNQKVTLIHHGFLLNDFTKKISKSENKLSQKYNPQNAYPVVGIISRYTEWKGIQYAIPAFKRLLNDYPNALLILANANGDYKTEIQKALASIPKQNYIEIPFEYDVASLYKLFDVFVHVPITSEIEAFGQTYVEALASGIPSVFTLSGIANEFIVNQHNALVVPHKNTEEIYLSLAKLIANPNICNKLVINGKEDTNKLFGLDKMILSLESLYKAKNETN